ncbi:hypothetical protein AB0C27_29530 [Nonomuraea sp. NPDC048882]|uniref:hypothetical protein n=1 Tax=unclassified Nonomuraea TaxID=2593643 RepID=UPI0033FDFED7
MKDVILCFVADGVVLATGTPALAAPKDPLAALRAQLSPGKGVTLKQRTVGKSASTLARSGRVRFDRRGIAASDLTAKLNVSGGDDEQDDTARPGSGSRRAGRAGRPPCSATSSTPPSRAP